MNSGSTTSSLKVPGTTSNRHQLRQRSPQGQRGRSRKDKSLAPPPPRTRWRRIRDSPWYYPALASVATLVLFLLYSAIRISSHTADYYPSHVSTSTPPVGPAKKPRIGRAGAPEAPPVRRESRDIPPEGSQTVRVGEQEMDEAIRSALEQTWHLESGNAKLGKDSQEEQGGLDETVTMRGERGEREAEGRSQKQRSLSELYEELDGLGISVDELNEVMQGAINGNL